jgi:hypothetical protein
MTRDELQKCFPPHTFCHSCFPGEWDMVMCGGCVGGGGTVELHPAGMR